VSRGASPQKGSQENTHRRKIRYLRVTAALMLLVMAVIGVSYMFQNFSHSKHQQDVTSTPQTVFLEPTEEVVTSNNEENILVNKNEDRDENKNAENTSTDKVVYITFDDGPSKYTDSILRILKQHNAKATFFLIGSKLNRYKSEVERIVEEGSYPGLHSMTHDYNTLYKSGSSANFIEEFQKEQTEIKEIVGFSPILIRAPYGSKPQIDETFRGDIAASGFRMWDWTLDSKDWNLPGKPDEIVELVSNNLHRDQEVILLHEREQTVQALPRIMKILEDRGYKFEVYDPNDHIIVNFSGDPRL